MDQFGKALLASAAIGALAVVPAVAGPAQSSMHVTALHAGKIVHKTVLHKQGSQQLTYTFGVYSYVSFSGYYRQKHALPSSVFFKWTSNTLCSLREQKLKVFPKKTLYGRASLGTETYSFGCSSGPATVYAVDYKITDPDAKGKTDSVHASLKGKFQSHGQKYKLTMNLDITIFIE